MEFMDIQYNEGSSETLLRLRENGVLLVTQKRTGENNVMTIGWGNIAVIWRLPIFTVLVRPSRHTFSFIEDTGLFTVCVPEEGKLGKALSLCGTKSGRDIDKFREAGLTTVKGRNIAVPVISDCRLFFECRVVYKQAMDPDAVDPMIIKNYYQQNDFHTIYYGHILSSYMRK